MLRATGLDVSYGSAQVLYGVDLEVPSGSLTCLMGRNGVGKSTLLKALLGVLPLRRGTIEFDGRTLGRMAVHERARMGLGYVPQGQVAFPRLSVRENLAVVREAVRTRDRAAVDEAIDLFPRLAPLMARPAGLLSGGQRQQLAIARALVARPRLLLLDEPTEGIQPSIVDEIEDAIAALHRDGMSVLLVEQQLDFALRLGQRLVVLDGGRVVRSGAMADCDAAELGRLLAV